MVMTSKVFIVQDMSLDQYCQMTMEYLHQKYHAHQTRLKDIPTSPEPNSGAPCQHTVDRTDWQAVADARGVPLGKLIV
jgi:hypothetical protein